MSTNNLKVGKFLTLAAASKLALQVGSASASPGR